MKRLPRSLDPTECRVLGALLEKEQTTPDYYPLTLAALTAACNQKSNRSPVMELDGQRIQEALDAMLPDVLVWKSPGARTLKWKQSVDRRWQLEPDTKAVLTELLLRGPQTPGELRARAERMHAFGSVDEVEAALARLSAGDEPLVVELPRAPGQKESRWMHLVGGGPPPHVDTTPELRAEPARGGSEQRLEALERRVAELDDRIRRLEG